MKNIREIALEEHHDFVGAKMGMWLFLLTELILFTGLFILYAMYRVRHAAEFHAAATELDVVIGTINTLVLLTSSLTVAVGIEALKRRNRKLAKWMVLLTVLFALTFLVNKYFEWSAKIHHGIFPGADELLSRSQGEIIYFNLYYAMTGLHGLHVLVGMGILLWVYFLIARKPSEKVVVAPPNIEYLKGAQLIASKGEQERWVIDEIKDDVVEVEVVIKKDPKKAGVDIPNIIKLENAGLYWHLVDIIWIFLFPLFYLIT